MTHALSTIAWAKVRSASTAARSVSPDLFLATVVRSGAMKGSTMLLEGFRFSEAGATALAPLVQEQKQHDLFACCVYEIQSTIINSGSYPIFSSEP